MAKNRSDLKNALFEKRLLESHAYQVPNAEGLVKLDAMENPFALPEALRTLWTAAVAQASLQRYPEAAAVACQKAVRDYWRLPEDIDLLFGNGSDELILLLVMAIRACGRPVLGVTPSFVMYEKVSVDLGVPFVAVPLTADFSLDMKSLRQALLEQRPALSFFAYPNNPTGNLFSEAELLEIIALSDGLVVIDEAYFAFTGGKTFLSHLKTYPNLLIMRTLSKSGLAGLRFGMLLGDKAWLDEINKLRLPYNINSLTQAALPVILEQGAAILREQADILMRERVRLQKALAQFPWRVWPSDANFILVSSESTDACDAAFNALLEAKILVKRFGSGRLRQSLRITVGSPQENTLLLQTLAAFYQN
jgi:histidinol-phosphate aminotransferase